LPFATPFEIRASGLCFWRRRYFLGTASPAHGFGSGASSHARALVGSWRLIPSLLFFLPWRGSTERSASNPEVVEVRGEGEEETEGFVGRGEATGIWNGGDQTGSDECGAGIFQCAWAVGCTDRTTHTMQTTSGTGGSFFPVFPDPQSLSLLGFVFCFHLSGVLVPAIQ
jgi:hypothetical protein